MSYLIKICAVGPQTILSKTWPCRPYITLSCDQGILLQSYRNNCKLLVLIVYKHWGWFYLQKWTQNQQQKSLTRVVKSEIHLFIVFVWKELNSINYQLHVASYSMMTSVMCPCSNYFFLIVNSLFLCTLDSRGVPYHTKLRVSTEEGTCNHSTAVFSSRAILGKIHTSPHLRLVCTYYCASFALLCWCIK